MPFLMQLLWCNCCLCDCCGVTVVCVTAGQLVLLEQCSAVLVTHTTAESLLAEWYVLHIYIHIHLHVIYAYIAKECNCCIGCTFYCCAGTVLTTTAYSEQCVV
jgi:hypothetical protein